MKVLAFGGSTSSTSINRQLARYAATLIPGAEVTALDLRAYELPMYSSDEEEANGIPTDAKSFIELIKANDAVIVSLAEHNGSYAAAFKNLYDWASRHESKVWGDKPMLLLSASPGGRGGATVMATAKSTFPRMGADLKATFSLPAFYDNFTAESGVTNPQLNEDLRAAVAKLTA